MAGFFKKLWNGIKKVGKVALSVAAPWTIPITLGVSAIKKAVDNKKQAKAAPAPQPEPTPAPPPEPSPKPILQAPTPVEIPQQPHIVQQFEYDFRQRFPGRSGMPVFY